MSLDTELPIFVRSAKTQYTRELLFSTPVNLMSLIFYGVNLSIHPAHQASSESHASELL